MTLRPIRDQDAVVLAALHAAAFVAPWSAAAIAEVLASPGVFGLVAEAETPRGFILARAVAGEAEILTLAVDPAVRRQGLGRALVSAVSGLAAQAASESLFLEVDSSNTAALALYESQGFRKVGRRKAYYADGADALVLRLGLNSPAATAYEGLERAREPDVDRLEKLCIEKGMRMTEQRRVIARVLSQSDDHPDVEELHRRAHAIDRHISIATVYRTVRLFEEAGIIARHDFRDGRARYEEASEIHHDHLIDLSTGKVVEFVDDEIEALQKAIARKLGYKLIDHRLELYGVPSKAED